MVRTNSYTNEQHKFYNSTLQAIIRGGGDCATKVVSVCACSIDMGSPVKTQVENGLSNLFDFHGQTIGVSDQAIFILKDSVLCDEEGKKTNVSDPLTVSQRRSGRFLVFNEDGPPRPGWPKLKVWLHDLQGMCSTPARYRWDRR